MQRRAGAEYGNSGRGNADGHRYRRTYVYPQPDAGANRYASAHLDTRAHLDAGATGYPAAATDAPAHRHAHAPADRYTRADCYAGSQSADERGPASVKRSKCVL